MIGLLYKKKPKQKNPTKKPIVKQNKKTPTKQQKTTQTKPHPNENSYLPFWEIATIQGET